jgi:hypothetical protein
MKINYDEILIGESEHGNAIITADMKDGKIRTLNEYWFIGKDNSADDNNYITCCGCGGAYNVGGVTYDRGMELAEDHEPFFQDEDLKQIILDNDFYCTHGSHCAECDTFHDTEDNYNPTYIIDDQYCELVCKSCAKAEHVMVYMESGDDLYKAKDLRGIDTDGFEEVHTIFHDCGWGGPATDHNTAMKIVDDLMEEHGELYCGLTGIGQFQVYVTLYKRV